MCGIAGIIAPPGAPIGLDRIVRMTRAVAHRGPDGEGYYRAPGVALGHRRLAIVDLSANGAQPMSDSDGQIWLTYNGEIYNFQELRDELLAAGCQFRSKTDTEVLLHLYRLHGVDMVHRLRGMFAFGLWDARTRTTLLVRDRIGIKPLFYTLVGSELRFASEMKALLMDADVDRAIDFEALEAFLAQRYVAAPATLLSAIKQLPAGYLLIHRAEESKLIKYWDLHFDRELPTTDPGELVEYVESELRSVVRSHLMGDVPYGALLSSGLDSATLVALLVQEHTGETLTFTAHMKEKTFGEGMLSARIAEKLGASNDQVTFGPPSPELLERVVLHAEEPTADMSLLPFYEVCKLARSRVAVTLSGEGADEIFAGYETYTASRWGRYYSHLPRRVRQGLFEWADALPDTETQLAPSEKLRRFAHGANLGTEAMHLMWRETCSTKLRARLLGRETYFPDRPPGAEYFAQATSDVPLRRQQYVDIRYYLPNDLLVKADRMSMAHGLETRVPYVDHKLMELAVALPDSVKLRHGVQRKWILWQIGKRLLPLAVMRKKRGFNIPLSSWLRGPLREFAGDCLSAEQVGKHNLFSAGAAAELLQEHLEAKRDRSFELFNLITLSLWARLILQRQRPMDVDASPPPPSVVFGG
jgi:asparagine synthase (glutamine-hydrolysing)